MYNQVAPLEERETVISIDYEDKEIIIYTTLATVMNRMERKGYKPTEVSKVDGEVCGLTFKAPIEEVTSFLRGDIFRYSSN